MCCRHVGNCCATGLEPRVAEKPMPTYPTYPTYPVIQPTPMPPPYPPAAYPYPSVEVPRKRPMISPIKLHDVTPTRRFLTTTNHDQPKFEGESSSKTCLLIERRFPKRTLRSVSVDTSRELTSLPCISPSSVKRSSSATMEELKNACDRERTCEDFWLALLSDLRFSRSLSSYVSKRTLL